MPPTRRDKVVGERRERGMPALPPLPECPNGEGGLPARAAAVALVRADSGGTARERGGETIGMPLRRRDVTVARRSRGE